MKRLLIIFFLLFSQVAVYARKHGQARVDSLMPLLSGAKEDTNKVKLMVGIANSFWGYGPDKGVQFGKQALALSEKLGWDAGIAKADISLALNYRYESDYNMALDYSNKAMQLFEKTNNKSGMSLAMGVMSVLYIDQSDYAKALESAFKSLNIYQELKDTLNIGKSFTNIGIIYEDQGDHANAMAFHNKAQKIYERLNNKDGIAIGLSNIGLVYKEQKDYSNSLISQFKALKICEENGNKNIMSKVLGYIGAVYKETKEYSKALQYLFRAVSIDEELGNKAGKAEKLQNIGLTYLAAATDSSRNIKEDNLVSGSKQKNIEKAIEALSEAAVIHKEIGNIKDLSENYRDLSTANELSGNYKEALQEHKQYVANEDSFNSAERNKQINILETKYETKEKDKQIKDQEKQIAYNRKINLSLALSSILFLAIGLLVYANQRKTSRLNKLITNQKTELEKLNGVKDRIFSVISHDLRTPVNSLVSFTQLLELGDIPPEKMQKYAGALKDNLGHAASLMENLLNWARTQMQGYNPVFENFDVAETAKQTVGLLAPEANKKNIRLANNIPADTIVFADMNMVSLLIRNLLSNAIKYTPREGTICLSAKTTARSVQIMVMDSGVGISTELVNQFNSSLTGQPLNSTPGTNKEKGTGLGLMLCKGFAGLMHGKLTLESVAGKGSCFTVELPAFKKE